MERGIILGPNIELDIRTNRLFFRQSSPDAALLRHAVLYWDRIDWPQNNIIEVVDNDIEFLKQAGVAQSTRVRLNAEGDMAALYNAAQIGAYAHLMQEEPGKWTMGQRGLQFVVGGAQANSVYLEIELNDALPTPPDGTPLAEVLEVRRKRQDEFKALRLAVDELYADILRNGSTPRAQNAAVERVQRAVRDVQKVVYSGWMERLRSSIKLDFSLPNALQGGVGGAIVAATFGIPQDAGAALGAAASVLKIEGKLGGLALPDEAKNFAYLYYVEKEFPGTITATNAQNPL